MALVHSYSIDYISIGGALGITLYANLGALQVCSIYMVPNWHIPRQHLVQGRCRHFLCSSSLAFGFLLRDVTYTL
jgi:hypothetical protein